MKRILPSVLLAIVAMMMFALPQHVQAQTPEAYVVQSADGKTLTFYYDTQKASRPGTMWGINDTQTDEDGTTSPAWTGTFNSPNKTITQAVFDPSFKNYRPTSTARWFNCFRALTQITGIENLNTSEVTNMSYMFYNCPALTQLDLSKFDTKNVTDMSGMFNSCALTQLDVSNFNTQNVTDMSYMFEGCAALTQLDVNKFNTANVTDMSYMFQFCLALTSLDLSHFNTEKVTNMSYMFDFCSRLTSLNLSNFNTANVTSMADMFHSCSLLPSLNLQNFNTAKVTDMKEMFLFCSSLTSLDLSNFNTANVTDMSSMFYGCAALTRLDVTKFKTQNVTDMRYMFGRCDALPQLDVTNFNTEKVTDMCAMFYGCDALTQLDVSKFVTKNVTDMSSMFDGCAALTTIYCNDAWTCGNSEDMFDNCKKLKGAVSYDSGKIDATMANPDTGYFTKKGPAGIVQTGHAATVKAVYSVDGRRLKAMQPGVNIVKMSDGTTRKVVKR